MSQGQFMKGKRIGVCLLLAAVLLSLGGCNRAWYRRQADAEAYALVREKGTHPHWNLEDYSIAVDPRSRMYYQYSPDCPPMPEDDPYSHELMQCVDGKRGWPFWDDYGYDVSAENPVWHEYLQFDERGVLVVNADDAVRIALLHSRPYQQSLETLYLSALDVSFERFQFDTQFFSANAFDFRTSSPLNTSAGNTNTTYGLTPLDVTVRKLSTTGSTFVAGLANSIVWSFNSAGSDSRISTTLFDFTFIQPFLRSAGRERVMERLTVSERTLLANVRSMEFYRQGFSVNVITGEGNNNGPTRRGGVFGAGLTGFTGVGGGFGGVGGGGGGGGGGGFGGAAAGAGQAGGYLGLLQTRQQNRNQQDNVDRLRSNLYRLEQTLIELRTRSGEPQLVSNILRQDLQVAQARQALVNAESTLLNARNNYQASLDNYKVTQLGLPPQICMEVNDTLLDDFQLIDPQTIQQQLDLEQIIASFGEVRLRIAQHIQVKIVPDEKDPTQTRSVRVIEWYPELEQDLQELKAKLAPVRQMRERLLDEHIPMTRRDLERLAQAIPRRKERLAQLKQELEESRQEACPLLPVPDINEEIFRNDRMELLLEELSKSLNDLNRTVEDGYERSLKDREDRIDNLLKEGKTFPPEKLFTELLDGILYPKKRLDVPATEQAADILVVLPADLLALQLVQARARTETLELAPVDLRADEALDIARRYRLDWMNARASLVDSWRLIEFNADQLQSSLNIIFSGDVTDVRTTQDIAPFNLGRRTGTLNASLQFDAPLTRLGERNQYRQSLIEYQQARRSYYQYEDDVARRLRGRIRTILTNELNFELQRLAVLEAARQIDRNEDIRIESELSGQATGATAARDAVSALDDLLQAQNNFMSIWVNIEVDRRNLDLELGTLQLDQDGLWIDPGVINAEYGQIDPWVRIQNNFVLPGEGPAPAPLPPAPAAPIPQGAIPDASAPGYTAGLQLESPPTTAVPTSGPLLPVRGQEALRYEPQPLDPAASVPGSEHHSPPNNLPAASEPVYIPTGEFSRLPASRE